MTSTEEKITDEARHSVVQGFFSEHRGTWRNRYDDHGFDSRNYRRRADLALSYLQGIPKGKGRLLELGCGAGVQAAAAHEMGWTVTAVDFTVPLLQQAKEEFAGPRWVAGTVEDLPFLAGSFDVVMTLGVIGYVNDPLLVLRRVYEVLAPGGFLIISWARERTLMESVGRAVSVVPDRVYMSLKGALVRARGGATEVPANFYTTYNRFWDREAFMTLLQSAGFTPCDARGVNFGQFRFMDRAIWSERMDGLVSDALERVAEAPGLQRLGHFTRTHVALARRGE